MHLRNGSLLQGGKYRIIRFISSGGFGCTYEAEHVMFRKRVAIKEFFVKDFCGRDERTAYVTIETTNKKDLVGKLKKKFIDEARSIFDLHHPGIVRVTDVFEENDTAYYVMDYIDGKSLKEIVDKEGALSESRALGYIRQVADALEYVHAHHRLHLDIKPGNIMIDGEDRAVLIDFGASKQYDEVNGENTSTLLGQTPGYAPPEQCVCEGISSFSASTDIYSLGATLYCLLQGSRPPKASIVLNEGLPSFPAEISLSTRNAIEAAMQPRRKDRPQRVDAFLALLGAPAAVAPDMDDEETEVVVEAKEVHPKSKPLSAPFSSGTDGTSRPSPKKWVLPLVLFLVAVLCVFGLSKCLDSGGDDEGSPLPVDSIVAQLAQVDAPIKTDAPETTQTRTVTSFYASTSPSGASVYVDGKYLGKTPIKDKEISLGSHTIKITLDGYKAYSKKSTFVEKPFILNETLEALSVEPAPTSSASVQPAPSKTFEISLNETLEVPSVEPVPTQPAPVQSVPNKTVTTGIINGHEWVDLGLSVKWATMNVGASSPSDYGSYFAWGEIRTKSEYTKKNSVTYKKNFSDISGNRQYDAARSNWGSSWRLPTQKELEELVNKCKWAWTTQGGHKGYTVTGSNGNSIFLPAAGCRYGASTLGIGVVGYYWSSIPIDSRTQDAYGLYFSEDSRFVNWNHRDSGCSVRAVSE